MPSSVPLLEQYVINVKHIAKFVVSLGDKVSPTDVEEGMRVGVDRNKYQIQMPLPPRIDPTVTMMTVEEKPDITYSGENRIQMRVGCSCDVPRAARHETAPRPQTSVVARSRLRRCGRWWSCRCCTRRSSSSWA